MSVLNKLMSVSTYVTTPLALMFVIAALDMLSMLMEEHVVVRLYDS